MDEATIRSLLEAVRSGDSTLDEALARLRSLPFESHAGLTLDHHRALRLGFPEAVYGAGKSATQVAEALRAIAARGVPAMATRVSEEQAREVRGALPEVIHHTEARLLELGARAPARPSAPVAVISAGASDRPVAEEAALTLEICGAPVERIADVGVSGLARLLAHRARFEAASVVIVVAGMEGALPSVVGGLVGRPLIAVPTSVGYGVSHGGVAALLGMLGSCAPGVTVVNIDNGYGAACAALRCLAPAGSLSSG